MSRRKTLLSRLKPCNFSTDTTRASVLNNSVVTRFSAAASKLLRNRGCEYGPDCVRYGLKPKRLAFAKYVPGDREIQIITMRGAVPLVISRLNEYMFVYGDQLKGENVLLSNPLKHFEDEYFQI